LQIYINNVKTKFINKRMEKEILLFLLILIFLIFPIKAKGFRADLPREYPHEHIQVDHFHLGGLRGKFSTSESSAEPTQTDQFYLTVQKYILATINYFINPELGLDERTGLVHNYITKKNGYVTKAGYTSITDIGLQLAIISGTYLSGMISQEYAREMIEKIIATLNKMEYYEVPDGSLQGCRYYFNYYDLKTLTSHDKFISSIDNACLVTGLIIARETFPELENKINPLVEKINFKLFYNPRRDLFRVGFFYNPETKTIIDAGSLYQIMNSETRMITYLAIGKGEIPQEKIKAHLDKLRIEQKEYKGIRVEPSFGGSAFEHGMPALFVDEIKLSPQGLGINLKKAFYIQILQAKERNYPVWGESPSVDENGYDTFGSPSGIEPYASRGVITPHASFLALEVIPQKAVENLYNIASLYSGAYDPEIGFADAINVNENKALYKYLALDQGMCFLAGLNFVFNGIIKNLFMQSQEGRKLAKVISELKFFTIDDLIKETENCYRLAKEYIDSGNWQMGEVLIDYALDLAHSYSLGIDFLDLNLYRKKIDELKQNYLVSLYQQAQSEIESGKLREAETTLIHLLAIDRNYLDALQKLEYVHIQIYK